MSSKILSEEGRRNKEKHVRRKPDHDKGEPKKSLSPKARLAIVIVSLVAILAASALAYILYVNSGYRNATGSFDYKITYNTRRYEFISSSQSIDMYQIKDLDSAECDCYVYVCTYDPAQDLQETLDIVNQTDNTNLAFMNTTVGSGDYPAIFVDYVSDAGGYVYLYYIDYNGKNLIIQTQADGKHQEEIDRMVASFTIIE